MDLAQHKAGASQVATGTLGLILAVGLGYVASKGGFLSLLAVGASAVFACVAFAGGQLRIRELMLWGVLLVAVLNFTPALFAPTNLADEPLWQKTVKDLAILTLFLFAALVPPHNRPAVRHPAHVLKAAVLLLALLMSLDVFLRETALLSFLASFRYYVLYPLIALAIVRLDFSRDEMLRVGKGIVLLGVIEGCLAVPNFLGFLGDGYYHGYLTLGGAEYTRPTATLGNPNNLGLFLGLPAILLMTRAVFADWRGKVLLVPILVGMALSFSKTVAVAVALALIIVAFFERKRSGWVRAGAMVAVSTAILLIIVAGRIGGNVTAGNVFGSRTTNVPEAFGQWTSNASTMLVGIGYGSQENVVGLRSADLVTTDNMPLQIALEGGLLGLTAFSFIVYAALRLAVVARRMVASRFTNGLGVYLLFFLLYAPVASNFRLFPGALFFWLVVGFVVTLGAGGSPSTQTQPKAISIDLPAARP